MDRIEKIDNLTSMPNEILIELINNAMNAVGLNRTISCIKFTSGIYCKGLTFTGTNEIKISLPIRRYKSKTTETIQEFAQEEANRIYHVLVHEIAHINCGHKEQSCGRWAARPEEIEAETIANEALSKVTNELDNLVNWLITKMECYIFFDINKQ